MTIKDLKQQVGKKKKITEFVIIGKTKRLNAKFNAKHICKN